MNDVAAFYRGEAVHPDGHTLDDVLGWDDRRLAVTHNFIQWLFPLRKASGQVPNSPILSAGEVDLFRSFQLMPGISGVSDGSAGLFVRGGTPDQNLILFDGMTIYHVDHFFGAVFVKIEIRFIKHGGIARQINLVISVRNGVDNRTITLLTLP